MKTERKKEKRKDRKSMNTLDEEIFTWQWCLAMQRPRIRGRTLCRYVHITDRQTDRERVVVAWMGPVDGTHTNRETKKGSEFVGISFLFSFFFLLYDGSIYSAQEDMSERARERDYNKKTKKRKNILVGVCTNALNTEGWICLSLIRRELMIIIRDLTSRMMIWSLGRMYYVWWRLPLLLCVDTHLTTGPDVNKRKEEEKQTNCTKKKKWREINRQDGNTEEKEK